jgi:hypothetical protein
MNSIIRIAALTLASAAFCSIANAASHSAHCELRVDGKDYLNAACPVVANKGGITVNVARKGVPMTYFAYVDLHRDGSGTASWNADRGSLHAWKPLGRVTREGECWINDRTRICAGR